MEWGKGEGGGEGDAHKGCGARGGDGNGQKSGSESSGPALFWAFRGEVAEKNLKFEDAEEIEGEGEKEGEEEPDDGRRLELEAPTESLA
jgi:hypothetical protein